MNWTVESQGGVVIARFQGHLDEAAGVQSAGEFVRAIAPMACAVVWDVREMTGYDAGARVAWQKALWPHRRNIQRLAVVGATPIVKAGALTLAFVIGAPCRFVATPADLADG